MLKREDVLDSLVDVVSSVTAQGVVKPRNEFVAVVFRHRHERSSHDTVLQSVESFKNQRKLRT